MALGKSVGLFCAGSWGCMSQGQLAGDVASVQRSSAPFLWSLKAHLGGRWSPSAEEH